MYNSAVVDQMMIVFENQSELLMEKIDEIRTIVEQLQPVLYLKDLTTQLNESKLNNDSTSVQEYLHELDEKFQFNKFYEKCQVCFIKDITIKSIMECLTEIDIKINEAISDQTDNNDPDSSLTSNFDFDED